MQQISVPTRFDFEKNSIPKLGTLAYLRENYAIPIPEQIAEKVAVRITFLTRHRDVRITVHGEKLTSELHNFISVTAAVNSKQQTEDLLNFSLIDESDFPIDTILVECEPTDTPVSIIVSVWAGADASCQ